LSIRPCAICVEPAPESYGTGETSSGTDAVGVGDSVGAGVSAIVVSVTSGDGVSAIGVAVAVGSGVWGDIVGAGVNISVAVGVAVAVFVGVGVGVAVFTADALNGPPLTVTAFVCARPYVPSPLTDAGPLGAHEGTLT
jgi:hypothetical protein